MAHTQTRPAPRPSANTPGRARARHQFGALPMTSKGTWQLTANALNAAQNRTG